MPEEHKLTKKEKKELRKLEWQEKAKNEARNAKIQKYTIWAGVGLAIAAVIFILFQTINAPTPNTSSQPVKVAPISQNDITNGNSKAKVTLIEYSDFQCPACAVYEPLINQLLNDYQNKLLFAYRMFPLTQAHKNAFASAKAGVAARNQGKFFEMSALLFKNQNDWATLPDPASKFNEYAKSLNLDLNKFKADFDSETTKKYVQASEDQAITEGINATPTFILNGKKIEPSRNYEDFKRLIDNELNKK